VVKGSGREANNCPLVTRLICVWRCISIPPYVLTACCMHKHKENFLFCWNNMNPNLIIQLWRGWYQTLFTKTHLIVSKTHRCAMHVAQITEIEIGCDCTTLKRLTKGFFKQQCCICRLHRQKTNNKIKQLTGKTAIPVPAYLIVHAVPSGNQKANLAERPLR
jgi:hypothetical protein